jgi:hypothetical protein
VDRNRRPPTHCWLAAPLIDSDRVSYMPIDDRQSGDNTERVEGNRVQLASLTSTSRDGIRRCLDSASGDS